jgi:glycosyltransferase involved in cell wall biosynthesis
VKPEAVFIAEAIIDYFDNNRKEQLTEGVKQEKEKFSWDKMTAAIIEVYNDI